MTDESGNVGTLVADGTETVEDAKAATLHVIRESCFMQGMTPAEVGEFAEKIPEFAKLYEFWAHQPSRNNEDDYSGAADNFNYLF